MKSAGIAKPSLNMSISKNGNRKNGAKLEAEKYFFRKQQKHRKCEKIKSKINPEAGKIPTKPKSLFLMKYFFGGEGFCWFRAIVFCWRCVLVFSGRCYRIQPGGF